MMLLHTVGDLGWATEPGVVAPLTVAAALYAAGVRSLRSRGARRVIDARTVVSFAAGWITLAVALVSPLHAVSDELFTAHMIQHELLMVVAAPLIVLGRPAIVMLRA